MIKIVAGLGAGFFVVAICALAVAIHHAGANQSGTIFRDYRLIAELWNPKTGEWTATGALPASRDAAKAALLANGSVLVVGGTPSVADEALLWNPTTGKWSAEPMAPQARNLGSLVSTSDGRVFALGGWDDDTTRQKSVAIRDRQGKWKQLEAPLDRMATAVDLVDRRLLVIDGDGRAVILDDEVFKPIANAVGPVGGFYGAILRLADGRALVVQHQFSKETAFAQAFDPTKETWTKIASLQTYFDGREASPEVGGMVQLPDGEVAILDQREVVLWDPRSDQISQRSASIPDEAGWVDLGDGRLLFAGGSGDSDQTGVIDLKTGATTLSGKLKFSRSRAALTRLPDGRVLATGGGDIGSTPAPSAIPGTVLAALFILAGLGGSFVLWRLPWFSTGGKIAFVIGALLGIGGIRLYFVLMEAIGGGLKG